MVGDGDGCLTPSVPTMALPLLLIFKQPGSRLDDSLGFRLKESSAARSFETLRNVDGSCRFGGLVEDILRESFRGDEANLDTICMDSFTPEVMAGKVKSTPE